jgi:flagellar hook-associated protein 3 FlgL
MRISTQSFQTQWLDDIYARQTEVARVQKQVSTGRNFSSAAEDPSAASQSVTLQQGIDRLTNFAANAETARRRLSLEENALTKFGDSLTRVRELAVQAGSGNLNQESRAAIAGELNQILQGLIDTANSQDGEGRYLFGGNQTNSTPFVSGSAGVQYNGDQGVRVQRIGDSRTVQENDPGSEVFQAVANGNGTFAVAANSANLGNAYYANASITSLATWVPGNYTVSFSNPTSYTVVDGSGATVSTGNYTTGQAIAFNGVAITLNGTPATGDQFTVRRSTSQDIFATVQNLVDTLVKPINGPADQAQYQSRLNGSLADIDQAQNHISLAHSRLGGRLAAIDDQTSSNQLLSDELQTTLSRVRDVDYPKALSDLQRQLTGLDAAYQVYAKVRSSSLFGVL